MAGRVVGLLALTLTIAALAPATSAAAPFTVTTTADPGTGGCDVTECTLREAIAAANAAGGADTIGFAVDLLAEDQSILIDTPLPVISGPTTVDGTTQPGYDPDEDVRIGLSYVGIDATGHGLHVSGGTSTIRGLAVAGFPEAGIAIASSDNTIGGTAVGHANLISSNGGDGVSVLSGNHNRIRGNSIVDNGDMEIELAPDGPTANDAGDADTGANDLQNRPIITAVTTTSGTTVEGELDSAPSSTYTIDAYVSPDDGSDCATSGDNAAGAIWVGQTTAVTDATGHAAFTGSHPAVLPSDHCVTVTATDAAGSTSEFSEGFEPPPPGAIISNGTVQLGVLDFGNLNRPGGTPSSGVGTTTVGLRYVPTNADSTAPGCQCEGWGVADETSTVTGYANESSGTEGLSLVSFTSTATTATSVVDVGTTFRVTHEYVPSTLSANLYEVNVSVENRSPDPTELRYRRVMDWDVEPTAFEEHVTIKAAGADDVAFTSDDGFATADALAGPSQILFSGDAVDSGPDDHGALFDFDFGTLAAGATKEFTTFYGAAATESAALNALVAAGGEIYSLGQPSTTDGPTLGTPNTFVFAFKGVGGTVIDLTPPTVTLVTPADGATTSDTTPELNGAAGTAPGDLDAITVKIWSGTATSGAPLHTLQATRSAGAWAIDSSTLAPGTYTARAEQSDEAGNTGVSDEHTFTVSSAPQLSVDDVSLTEGNSGSANAAFTVSLDVPAPGPVTVTATTSGASATSGTDFTAVSVPVSFSAGDQTKTVNVPILGDTLDEADETYTLTLSSASGAGISDATGIGTITDDDGPPTLSVSDPSVTEGNAGSANLVYALTLSGASGKTITVDRQTNTSGTATAGTDFTALTAATVTFLPGETSKNVTVSVTGDTLDEVDETIQLALSAATNVTAPDLLALGTITDDDGPTISINDVSAAEGASAGFTVTLSAASPQAVSVQAATANGSAAAPGDFTAASGPVNFPPGTTSVSFPVATADDSADEPDETFTVALSSPVRATIADGSGTGTILDQDATPDPSPSPSPSPSPTPTPTPTPTPSPDDPITGVPTGTVLVHLPGQSGFVPLQIGDPLPLGAIIDATHGVIKLVVPCDPALDKKCEGGIQSGEFYGGRFQILRTRGNQPITELLLESAIGSKKPKPNGIPTAGISSWNPMRILASATARRSKLWATTRGRFRTRGRNASATVRGTKWFTDDRKPSVTVVKVTEGSVKVRDFVKRKTVTVKKGGTYRAKRARR